MRTGYKLVVGRGRPRRRCHPHVRHNETKRRFAPSRGNTVISNCKEKTRPHLRTGFTSWWSDSNRRRQCRSRYALPTAKRKPVLNENGLQAGGRTRTDDLRITNALLYQLSHTSIFTYEPHQHYRIIISHGTEKVKRKCTFFCAPHGVTQLFTEISCFFCCFVI